MIKQVMRAVLALVGMSILAGPASAAWFKARSKHFVVYRRGVPGIAERQLRDFARQLEQLDTALRLLSNAPDREGIEANPVTIYMLPNVDAVQALYSSQPSGVAGFYVPRVTGSVAFTPISTDELGNIRHEENSFSPNVVFFHEYGHHFLLGNFAAAYPAWFSEGYAEVVSTVTFNKNIITLGNAANHRADWLLNGTIPTSEQLFSISWGRLTGEQVANIYAFGWLLTHWVMFNDGHARKFETYLKLLNHGTPSVAAAQAAFGDLKQLDRDLKRYLSSRLPGKIITLTPAQEPVIDIQPVSAGVEAMMNLRMRSERGVDHERAPRLFEQGKEIAAHYPDDPVVQGWLAEMAYDAEQDDVAAAAADRALAVDPASVQALLYKARALLRQAGATKADAKAWTAARAWIVKANRADPNNAAPLALYYSSFADQGIAPSKAAVDGLLKAFDLVPQDDDLRFSVARHDLMEGHVDLARATLAPIAYDPHGSGENPVAALIADLGAGKTPTVALAAYDAAVKKAEEDAKKKGKRN